MWPLLACSVFGLAVIAERALVFLLLSCSFRGFVSRIEPLLRARRVGEALDLLRSKTHPMATVARTWLKHADDPSALRDEVVGREGSQQLARLERRVNWLSMIGHLAPLIGLLGTVTGLVSAFHEIELKGGVVQPNDLAAGIWEALITTVFGLVIAIPCMAAYHLFDHRAGTVAIQMQWLTAYLSEWLQKQGPAHTPAFERPREGEAPLGVTAD